MNEEQENNTKKLFEQSIDLFLGSIAMRMWAEFLKPYAEDNNLELTNEKIEVVGEYIKNHVRKIEFQIRGHNKWK